jgi:signal transduction histidine kinase
VQLKLRLSDKGLLLVAVLLFLELLFVGAMAQLLNRAEKDAKEESHSKEIVGKTNHLFQLLYDGGNAAADYQMHNGGRSAAERYHAVIERIPQEVQSLKALVADNPNYLTLVNRIDQNSSTSIKLVSLAMRQAESGNMLQALMTAQRSKPAFERSQNAMFADLRELMNEQEKIIAETPAAQARSRGKLKQLLMLGVGVNIAIALIFALFFVRGITRRLDLVVDNTSRLLKREPLNPELSGSDEIATLDHAFHEMASSLKEVEQMKQEFVSMISHDLRVPLTTVKGFLELLSDGAYGSLTEQGQQRTELAERNITRLIALINELLDMEKMESGKLELVQETIPLSPVVSRSLDSVRGLAEEHHVTLLVGKVDCNIYADSKRIEQVLVNLLSNALKFSPENSTITVSATSDEQWAEVSVRDEGRGIAAKYHDAVFQRFRQVLPSDSDKGGSGLGLAICKAIIEQHEGKIGILSQEGKGSTFWFRLPAKPIAKTIAKEAQ